MSLSRINVVARGVSRLVVRTCHHDVQLSPALKNQYYPKLGNRDIVGYGFNGNPVYMDRAEFPAPAIRFKENTKEVLALRQKEKGDWKAMSLEDKRNLYRSSFRETYAEMHAPTGEWKSIVGIIFFGFAATGWVAMYIKKIVLGPVPHTITVEWQEKQLERLVRQRQGAIDGAASHWDYENNRWK